MANETQPGIHESVYKEPGSREQNPATEVNHTEVQKVEGQTVILRRSAAQSLTAERATLEQSAAKTIDAKSVQMDQSAAQSLAGERTVLQRSGAAQISAKEVRLVQSNALLVHTEQAHVEQSRVLILAGNTTGDVQPTMTLAGAAVLGGTIGAGLALVIGLLKFILTRR